MAFPFRVVLWYDVNRPERRVLWHGGATVTLERAEEVYDGELVWHEVDPSGYDLSIGKSEWFQAVPDVDEVERFADEILQKDW